MKNIFLVLEGTHGAGKSDIARSLHENHGFFHVRTPPLDYDVLRPYMHDKASGISRFLFYMAGNADVAKEAKQLLANGPVVCDRYLTSTIASCSVDYGLNLEMLVSMAGLMSDDLIQPDRGFFLRVDSGERMRRLKVRLETEPLYKVNPNPERIRKLEEVHLSLLDKRKWSVLDTSEMSMEEVVEFIVNSL